MPEVTIIGAGISGLACAWALKKRGIDSVVLESSARAGGVIRTERVGGFQVEAGPNSFQAAESALNLVEEIGLTDDLLPPAPHAARFVYWNRKLRKFPFGPLSTSGIARLLGEPLVRSKATIDESVRDFFVRRVGRQAHDRLVAPALTGIYAGNTADLSMTAVFPKIVEMEREHGSLTRAFLSRLRSRPKPSGARTRPRPKGAVFSFPDGVETLPRKLAEQLNVQYEAAAPQLADTRINVITAPAYHAADLLESRTKSAAAILREIHYAPIVVAAISLPDHSFAQPLQGFGFLVPRDQGLHLLGALFSSALFPDRAPKGKELLTCFLGGTFEPDAVDWPEDRIWETVCGEIQSALRTSEAPEPVALFRYRQAIPQYKVGHQRKIAALQQELLAIPGVFLTGSYVEGVSVPACIEQADRTAARVADYLRSPQ